MNYRRRWKRANSRSTGSKCVLPNGMTGPKPTTHSRTTTNPFVALEIGIGESTSKRLLTRPANKKNVVIVIDIQGAPSPANPKFHAIRPQRGRHQKLRHGADQPGHYQKIPTQQESPCGRLYGGCLFLLCRC